MKEAYDHHRVTPEGRAAGVNVAKLAEKAIAQLADNGEKDERCKTCAFRAGTVPNGCAQTQADAMKAVFENVPFTCHQKPGWPCHGWFAMRVALKDKIPDGLKCPWEFSPPDEDFETVEKAEAKRERRAAKRRKLSEMK